MYYLSLLLSIYLFFTTHNRFWNLIGNLFIGKQERRRLGFLRGKHDGTGSLGWDGMGHGQDRDGRSRKMIQVQAWSEGGNKEGVPVALEWEKDGGGAEGKGSTERKEQKEREQRGGKQKIPSLKISDI